MKSNLLTLLTLFCSFTLISQSQPLYIESFKTLAIQEMERTGIPASITLAQGILESAWGKGVLARSSNNHFGIKCKSDWLGSTFYLEDDDFNAEGKLIQSCFRGYETVEASYIDHSDFLVNNKRYALLFALNPTDYVGWARGLQTCGYATDPQYAEKLIRKIEEYALFQYDLNQESETFVMEAPSYELPDFSQEALIEVQTEEDVAITESTKDAIGTATDLIVENEVTEIEIPVDPQAEVPESPQRRMTMHSNFGLVAVGKK